MTILEIHKKEQKIRRIDLTSVEEIRNNLEYILMHRKSMKDRSHIKYSIEITEKIRNLNKDQLRYLSTSLIGLVNKFADLYQSTLDKPEEHLEFMKKFRKLKKDLKGVDKLIKQYPIKPMQQPPASSPYEHFGFY